MSINFSSLEIGRSALNANQLGIDITGQNIANVNTPGYTRRTLRLAEAAPAGTDRFAFGAGVSVQGLEAFRDHFIESRIQNEIGIAGTLIARRDALSPVQSVLQGTDGANFQTSLEEFFGSFRDLEANPDSQPLRSVVAGKADNLANSFHTIESRLGQIKTNTDSQLRATVNAVNSLAERISYLNVEVRKIENAGGESDGLQNSRNELVNELSELTGARVTRNEDATINVTIGEGQALVAADTVNPLVITSTADGFATININSTPAVFREGTIKGFQSAIETINEQQDVLDGIAQQVVTRVNGLHTSGTDLDGNPGVELFDTSVPVTARTISINDAVLTNNRLIVASPIAQPAENGTIAGQIANLISDNTNTVGTKSGSFSSIYGSLLSDAGEQVRSAENGLETQAAIISQATAQRESVSGVSLDEEAINLLQYQKAFEAAARFIQVADEMTQTILSLAG